MNSHRKPAARAGFLAGGVVLGALLGYFVGRAAQIRAGRDDLQQYATRLLKSGNQLGADIDDAITAVASDNLPFCSDEELEFMRELVYRAQNVKDIGRTKDNKLYCSTGIGRLAVPKVLPVPDVVLDDMKITMLAPIMISKRSNGFITEYDGVSVILNPDAYARLDEPPREFSGYLYDEPDRRALHGFGHVFPVSSEEVIEGKLLERGGVLYQPMCLQRGMVCVVAAEPRATILAGNRLLLTGCIVGGALLGAAIGLILILSLEQQRSMESQLRRAIRKNALTLAYQPVIALDTGAIVGAEALVRWTNDAGVAVRPDIFIALAEERGFVSAVTKVVICRAFEEMGDLLRRNDFRLTLNIAADDLKDASLFELLDRCMAGTKVPASSVGLELTERSTADAVAVEAVAQLKASGHSVYIDDFGTGYSSLAYLHRLHVDAIKIDRAFTQTVGTGAVTASVVPQILDMATQLGLLVVVEGIETEEQAAYFRGTGRGILGQGWLFGKPVPAAAFRKLLPQSHDETAGPNPALEK